MNRFRFCFALSLLLSPIAWCAKEGESVVRPRYRLVESIDVADVPADFRVGFSLLTNGDLQYAAYYDKDRNMTVASRRLGSKAWHYRKLPSKVGWDSHNYVTMAVDRDGHLHVSGNMHCVPLVYFRTKVVGDIDSLEKQSMTGQAESRVTYPRFMTDLDGELIFIYRDGGSGNGRRLCNRYDPKARRWSRLVDQPLLDGKGKRNAYPKGPVRGPDGWFHMVWVWRNTPDCATNHHLSYTRSRDLVHWESISGQPATIPITLDQEALWVDPIPPGGGIINGCERLFFESSQRPLISYHKSDEEGNMQVYIARFEAGKWVPHQLTDWDKPVPFSGGGSMGFIGIRISGIATVQPGVLTISYRHKDYGSGRLFIDEDTLRPLEGEFSFQPQWPKELGILESDFEGMSIRRAGDLGEPKEEGVRYMLQWESLGPNRDRPRQGPLPPPSQLRLLKLKENV